MPDKRIMRLKFWTFLHKNGNAVVCYANKEYNQIAIIYNLVPMSPIQHNSALVQVMAPHNTSKEMEFQNQSTNVQF